MADAYDYIPAEIAATIPPLYGTEGHDDPTVHVKLFTPDGDWTWYLIEYDPVGQICFAFVDGLECEMGYISLDELRELTGPKGLRVERDLFYQPEPLSILRARIDSCRGLTTDQLAKELSDLA